MTEPDAKPEDLSWLLEKFLKELPGSDSAILASPDGMKHAFAGLSTDQADSMAAIIASKYASAKSIGAIRNPDNPSGVRQVIIELDDGFLFVVSAGRGLPRGTPAPVNTDPRTVSTILAVLTDDSADAGWVGHEIVVLAKSVAEHLETPTRTAGL